MNWFFHRCSLVVVIVKCSTPGEEEVYESVFVKVKFPSRKIHHVKVYSSLAFHRAMRSLPPSNSQILHQPPKETPYPISSHSHPWYIFKSTTWMGTENPGRGGPETETCPTDWGVVLQTQPFRGSGLGVSKVDGCNPPTQPGLCDLCLKEGFWLAGVAGQGEVLGQAAGLALR